MKNGVVLITYADSLGGSIASLRSGLEKHFPGCITGVHLLPFFPSSGDRGFSPLRYDQIDPRFGDWIELSRLGSDYELIADFMVNHISRESVYFKDWLEYDEDSSWSGLFLPVEKVFDSENPAAGDIALIYRRQPREPWLSVKFKNGKRRLVWCTFSEQQIDIDITSEQGLKLFRDSLSRLRGAGIRMVRLDAIGYIIKKKGTSCFMVEPDIWEVLDELKKIASDFGIELLPEMHEHYSLQLKMAERGFPVYDFALPLLLLYAHYAYNFNPLKKWFSICPRNQFTTLDTHDGIGIVDATDLLSREQTDFTVEKLYSLGSNIKRKYSTSEYQNLDIYQINCTYYSALGEDDDAYITARAIQFFAPGIPQIYYVGMLAGRNDLKLVEKTRNGRDINRHNYSTPEIKTESEREVVRRLKDLMRFRSECNAFNGDFSYCGKDDSKIIISWETTDEKASLSVDLSAKDTIITVTDEIGCRSFRP